MTDDLRIPDAVPEKGDENRSQLERELLLLSDALVKITAAAVFELLGEGSLNLPLAVGSRHSPAGTAGVPASVDAVETALCRCRTDPEG